MTTVHVVLPPGVDDPGRPSGGNVYDRRVCDGLRALGWTVHEHSRPVLSDLPDGALVLLDGLVAHSSPDTLAAHLSRLRIVVLLHMPFGGASEHAMLSASVAVVTTSQWTASWLRTHYGLAHGVRVVEPGTEPADLATSTPSGGRLLCVGAVTSGKGHDVLLDALRTIGDLGWECVCVGATDLEPSFVRDLREGAAGLPLTFTGPLTGDRLDQAYAESDLLVHPSRAEAYGMVLTEALARGLPVLATYVGGVPEALGRHDDGTVPGILLPPGDAGALATALRLWLADPALRERLRHAAHTRRPTLPGWDRTVQGIAAALSEAAPVGART